MKLPNEFMVRVINAVESWEEEGRVYYLRRDKHNIHTKSYSVFNKNGEKCYCYSLDLIKEVINSGEWDLIRKSNIKRIERC